MKLIATLIVFITSTVILHAAPYNIYNLFSVDLPKEFEVHQIDSGIRYNSKFKQYWLTVYISFIYRNVYLTIDMQIFGNGEKAAAAKKFGFERIDDEYSNNYNSALNGAILKSNQFKIPTKAVSVYEFISDWASDYVSDAIAYRFDPNVAGIEVCIFQTLNSWNSFDTKRKLKMPELDFWNKLKIEDVDTQKFYLLYRKMMEEIAQPKTDITLIDSKFVLKTVQSDLVMLPSINNLRLRESETTDSKIIGYVLAEPYYVVQEGRDDTIDGIKGKWLRIRRGFSNKIGWAFSGYLRIATKEELAKFSGE
ncbi:SH3 domain-containing protein [Armatimonadetes bacterium]|nr:SH3 domain-containing protein [bacterium]